MKYDFETGEKIHQGKGGEDFYFVGQVGDTVYATREKPGFGVAAGAYTDRTWVRAPKPFFEVQKEYRHASYSLRYTHTIHHVFEMGGKRYAASLNNYGNEAIWNEDDFSEMEEV